MGKKFDDSNDENLLAAWKDYELSGGTKHVGHHASCHYSHPVLKIGKGELLGASCTKPRDGFDVYVGLDSYMSLHGLPYPWESNPTQLVFYPITDKKPPHEIVVFTKMIDWLCNQLQEGKKIHVGCIGGHGRTGMVLAAIMSRFGEKDAIGWVRKNHCKKAVETSAQVNYLMKNFGVEHATGSKDGYYHKESNLSFLGGKSGGFSPTGDSQVGKKIFAPAPSKKSIWAT